MLCKSQARAPHAHARTSKVLSGTFVFLSLFTLSFIGVHLPAPSVITELKCNEGTGTTTADASGNGHNGTLTNGPTWVAGKEGQGINLDGTNDYINLADHADYTLTPTVSYTWSAWVKNNNFNQWSTVWSQTLNTTNFFYFYAHTSNDAEAGPVTNGLSVYWFSGSSKLVIHSNNNVLTTGTWSYVTVTYNAGQPQASRFTIYVNGNDVTNRSDVVSTGTIAAVDPTNIRIGSNQPFGEYLNGSVDEVRYYRRLLSVAEIQSDMNIANGPLPDMTAPTVNITSPAAGNVSGTINVNANAADNVGVSGAQFLLDGNNLGVEDISSPYSVSWNTTSISNGNHTLTAKARDAAGNVTTSASVIVNVNNDVTAPTVNITSPAAGNVSGTINVNANASDNIGVAGVQFLLDGNNLGAEDVSSPYSVSWNTTTATSGNHTLTARARDAAGNVTTSASVIVNVNNNDVTAPTVIITSPAAGNVSGTINVNANASDNIGVAGVQFLLDGNNLGAEDVSSPYSVSWNTTATGNGSHTLTARARDAAGNTTTSAVVNVTVNNDVTAPAVSITAPSAGNVSGTINVTANASDNVAVTGVQFLLDGNNLGTEDLSAPFSVSWNTTTASNGDHNLTARARDAAGNTTLSAIITVTVNNDITAPTISVDAPATSPVSGTINITATANDNIGVAGVQFLLDGNNLGTEDIAAPYSVSWNTLTAGNGNHSITARARDAAGNTTTSATVVFNVVNNSNGNGPVAAYGFNENTGTATNDNSGNGNTGTFTNGPVWSASGKYGSAISFDGINDFINVNDANSLDLTNGMTMEAWINPTSLTDYKSVLCKENGTTLAYALSPNNNTTGTANQRPNTRIRIGTTTTTVTGPAKIPNNTWTHIACTYDGSVLRLFINGTQVATTNVTGNMSVTANPFRIGGSTALGQYFPGLIDEVRVYNRALSQAEIQSDMNTPIAPDAISPTVSITAPAAGDVSGTVSVTANASDNIGVAGVQFLLDGNNLSAEDVSSPYSVSWNTTTVTSGNHILTARARDAAGNVTTSASVIVNVNNNDVTAPTVNITAPAAGNVSGTININANASDNIAVTGVQFLVDGNNVGAEDITAPYSVSWNTTTIANGNHTLTAKARDAAGNTTTSADVIVNVNNDLVSPTVNITAPSAGTIAGTVDINADANDNVGVVGVQFLLNGNNLGAEDLTAPYSFSWNTNTVADGDYTLTAKARDATGNITTSSSVIVTILNHPPDTEFPTVGITSPQNGEAVGTVTITADANDNVGVVGVQFLLNGNNFGSEDLTPPYSVSWNTLAGDNGMFTITAKARDAAGNITTSPGTMVMVNNPPDSESPTVSITAPPPGNVSGTINITANASDNIGVTGVLFLLDGNPFDPQDSIPPYSLSWNTRIVNNGTHTLTAIAKDAAGNTGTSAGVIVTVSNDLTAPTINITAPAAGNISGTVNVTANANDNVGVAGVQILLDGNNLGAEDVSSPYSVSWITSTVANGTHTLTAKARDAEGNSTTSSSIIVTVNNVSNLLTAINFNEGTGTTAADLSGNNHTGTLTSSPTWTPGKYGQAVNLNGTSSYVNIADHNDYTLDPAQKYTWSAWIKNTSFKEWSTVWSQTVNTTNFFYFYAHTTTDQDGGPVTNGISVYWWNGGSSKLGVHSNNNVLTAGQWSHVTVTYDGSQAQNNRFSIYVNGLDVTARTDVASVGTITAINPTNVRIGSNQPFGEYFNGAVDEVRYYNRLLTPAEIQSDMNTPIGVDNVSPAVTISAPVNNSFVSGTANVTANASDNIGVAGVQFLLDGNNIGAEDITSPYSVSWNTTTATNGNHILTAKARDAVGNITTSANIVVKVDNTAPSVTITSPAAGTIAGNVDINANASDNNGVVGVQFLLNGNNLGAEDLSAPYSFTWNTLSVADGNYILTARARDTAGNITTSSQVSVNVLNHAPDTEFPTTSITSPTAGEIVGTINVTADANDNTGIVGVQFLLNGVNLGSEDIAPPYSVSWNTLNFSNGNYRLTAKARDAAGNITTSAEVVVTVNNPPDTESPLVNITAPSAGNISGTINVNANASDNAAVVGVQFLLNGNDLGAEDLTPPYSISWNTKLIANGIYTLTARARDAAGNVGVSADVVITVNNDNTPPTIDITSPAAGNVSGTINVNASANDNVGVVGVQFLLDGNNLGAEDITAPYSVSWNTTTIINGNHILTAIARDAEGNTTTSAGVNITVANTTPVISAISFSSITESSAIIKWTTNIPATSQVNYGTAITYGLFTLVDSALVTSHSMILNSLAPGTLYHYQVLSGNSSGSPATSADNTFTTASLAATLGTMNTHTVFAYPAGKIVPWTPNPTNGYDTVLDLTWNYLLNLVPNDPSTGKPAYYSRSYLNPNTQQVVGWPHNPAGLYGMLIESGLKYYGYSGNANVMQLANDVATWHLDHGMTIATDSWPNVPYSEGIEGSTTYGGAPQDGVGVLEPDKIGELAYGWLQLYKFNGNTRYRDAAIQAGNVLSSKIRAGNQTQSPWPFRVNAHNGNVVENYCSNIIGPVSLLDGLIAAGLGDTALYRATRNAAWTWMMTFPMVNNVWSQYFEDVGIQGSYNSNLNQYNGMMVARYLLEHPEMDPNWLTHVRGLITWVEATFLQTWYGANTMREQQEFFLAMGSHTSRYASVNALLYEKTGDTLAKEKAYRSFNWATYMCRNNGICIDGPDVNNQWFTDGYGDYIRHFMTGLGAVPEWSPANQTHLVRSSSVIKNISYGSNTVSYTTSDGTSTEVVHISFNPVVITANGIVLPHRSDLSQPGWTLDVATKTLRIYHVNATQIVINPPPPGGRLITQNQPANDSVIVKQDKIGNEKNKTAFINKAIDELKGKDLEILPNPTNGNFALKYTAQDQGRVVIRISDVEGKLVFTTNKSVNKGYNMLYLQSASSWKPGIYFISVQQDNNTQREKLIYQY